VDALPVSRGRAAHADHGQHRTTITPWQIFFQQSAVVDKGMDIRDIRYGKIDTFVGPSRPAWWRLSSFIATAGVFFYHPGARSRWIGGANRLH